MYQIKTTIYLLIIALVLFLPGCKKSEAPSPIEFNAVLQKNIIINEGGTGTVVNIDKTVSIDATTNPNISPYAENIESYTIDSIFFTIDGYESSLTDEIYFNGSIGFSPVAENSAESSCSVNYMNVTHIAGTGDFEINSCLASFSTIADALKEDNQVKIYMSGTLSKTPVSFNLSLKIYASVKAIS